jgi:long-subunit fatty acid transport protein
VVGAIYQRTDDLTFGTNPEASGDQAVSNNNLNYFSASYPFTLINRNMIISVNHQHLYNFYRQWNFSLALDEIYNSSYQNIEIDQDGSLSAIGLAYCIQVTPVFSFGFTLNFWQDGLTNNQWESNISQSGSGNSSGNDFTVSNITTHEYSFRGINANLGILWELNNQLTLGLILKTPFTAVLTHTFTSDIELLFPGAPSNNTSNSSSTESNEDLDMPMSYGIGLAYRFSDKLTASLDIYRTEWDNFILTDSAGNKKSPITNESADEADIDPTHQIRAGAEYLHITNSYVIPFRGGVFYDPSPAPGEPDHYYGFSLGSGFAKGKIAFDMAYQYRFGKDVGQYIRSEPYDFKQDVSEHTIYTSVIYHF